MLAHEADWVLADAQQLRFVNLDEYVGVPSSDRRSFSASCVGTFSSL
jgi:6-phosphogluconolactonase/glucosamine-6-phosphate isomerase/deaminase